MAAQRFLELYDVMHGADLPRAPVALWSAGLSLSELPGREEEALRVLRQFLSESTTLTDDAEVRDWRSEAVSLIDELEARAPAAGTSASEELGAPDETSVTPDNPDEESTGRASPAGPVILAVGGVTLVVGVIVGAFSLSMDAAFRDECDDLTMCPTRLRPQYEEMRTFSTVADVLMVAGGAVAIAGLVLTLVLTEEDEPANATVSATCFGSGCLAIARGSF